MKKSAVKKLPHFLAFNTFGSYSITQCNEPHGIRHIKYIT